MYSTLAGSVVFNLIAFYMYSVVNSIPKIEKKVLYISYSQKSYILKTVIVMLKRLENRNIIIV